MHCTWSKRTNCRRSSICGMVLLFRILVIKVNGKHILMSWKNESILSEISIFLKFRGSFSFWAISLFAWDQKKIDAWNTLGHCFNFEFQPPERADNQTTNDNEHLLVTWMKNVPIMQEKTVNQFAGIVGHGNIDFKILGILKLFGRNSRMNIFEPINMLTIIKKTWRKLNSAHKHSDCHLKSFNSFYFAHNFDLSFVNQYSLLKISRIYDEFVCKIVTTTCMRCCCYCCKFFSPPSKTKHFQIPTVSAMSLLKFWFKYLILYELNCWMNGKWTASVCREIYARIQFC